MTSSHFFSGHLDPTPSFLIFTVFAGAKTVATLVQWRNVTFVMVKTWLHNRGWEWSISMWFEGHFSMDGWLVVVCSWWFLVLSEWKTMITWLTCLKQAKTHQSQPQPASDHWHPWIDWKCIVYTIPSLKLTLVAPEKWWDWILGRVFIFAIPGKVESLDHGSPKICVVSFRGKFGQ